MVDNNKTKKVDTKNPDTVWVKELFIHKASGKLGKRNRGNSGVCTFENVLALVNLAKVNKRITWRQSIELKRILKRLKKIIQK